MWPPKMIWTQAPCILLMLTFVNLGEPSYLPKYLPTRYYTPSRSYTDDNVYITDKYGQVVSVEPYWSRSSKSYQPTPVYTRRCYNCVASPYYQDYPRKVYVKDRFGNSVLINPEYLDVYRREYYPSSRSGRYYTTGRGYSHEDYVYINDMYGRTRAVPKSSYLYEYAKGY